MSRRKSMAAVKTFASAMVLVAFLTLLDRVVLWSTVVRSMTPDERMVVIRHDPSRNDPSQAKQLLLPPQQLFDTWKQQHSAAVLRSESPFDRKHHRQYLLARLTCPRQAGVQAALYTNTLLLAILTNRTLLYEYRGFINEGANDRMHCQDIMQPAEWVPEFEEFRKGLGTPFDTPLLDDWKQQVEQGTVEDWSKHLMIRPSRQWGFARVDALTWHGLMDFRKPEAQDFLMQAYGTAREVIESIAAQLYSEGGALFLYGMLYAESFAFTDALLKTVEADVRPLIDTVSVRYNKVFGIGLHSRHMHESSSGNHTMAETACLDYLLKTYNSDDKKPCHVYLMSDREATLQAVAEYAQQHHDCNVSMVTQRSNVDTTDLAEHGPFAGAGYFQDLILVSHAESAFVSRIRSSSVLVQELLEYRRRLVVWSKEGVRGLPNVPFCNLGSADA